MLRYTSYWCVLFEEKAESTLHGLINYYLSHQPILQTQARFGKIDLQLYQAIKQNYIQILCQSSLFGYFWYYYEA